MKRPEKRDDVAAPRVMARELDGGFDRFGAGVREKRFRPSADRRQLRDELAERDLRLVVVVRGNVQKARSLFGDRPHDIRMRMPGGVDGNARAAVQVDIAVDILDDGTFPSCHDEWRAPRIRRRHHRTIARQNRLRARTRRRHFDVRDTHWLRASGARLGSHARQPRTSPSGQAKSVT